MIEKKSKCLVILILRRFRGGPVEGFMGGASLETFSGEAQLKKPPCIKDPTNTKGASWMLVDSNKKLFSS